MIPPSISAGKAYRFLLDLTFAGRVWRFTSGPDADITDNGATLRYRGGLTLPSGYSEVLELWASEPAKPSISIRVDMPEDVALLVSQGHSCQLASGTLRLWYEGSTIQTGSRVLCRGRLVQPVYGQHYITGALEPDDQTSILYPPLTARVDPTTWAAPDPAIVGQFYPTPIGEPGRDAIPTPTIDYYEGSPGLLTVAVGGILVIAIGPVVGTSVRYYNSTTGASSNTAPALTTDLLGRRVSYIWPAAPPVFGDEVWIGWPAGGGIVDPYGQGGCLDGAGHVIRWCLDMSGLDWDRNRAADLDLLNGVVIGTYIMEQVDLWAWAKAQLAPLLPLTVAWLDGITVVPWKWDPELSDAVLTLEVGRNVDRVSDPVYQATDLYSKIRIDYCPKGNTGQPIHHVTWSHEEDEDDSDQCRHPLLVEAFATLAGDGLDASRGHKELVISCPHISRRASAELMLSHLAHKGSPAITMAIQGGTELECAELGRVVRFVDADFYRDDLAHIVGRSYVAGGIQLTLYLPA